MTPRAEPVRAGFEPSPAPRRAILALWAPIAGLGCWAAARYADFDRGAFPQQLLAFTPYVAAAAALVAAATLLVAFWARGVVAPARRWSLVAAAVAVAVALVTAVAPRAIANASGGPLATGGPVVRVMTSNMLLGSADAAAIVDLVRERRVDLLAVQELTPRGELALDAAGLGTLLGHRVTFPLGGAAGSGLYSRFPLDATGGRAMPGGFYQAMATVEVPGARRIGVESVHTCAPMNSAMATSWRADFGVLPAATRRGSPRILLGDFNATLDHAVMRRLLKTGYRDAAAVAGAGLSPTWPYDGRRVPKVTIDHVLADRSIGVRDVWTRAVPGTDHRAVLVELALPPA